MKNEKDLSKRSLRFGCVSPHCSFRFLFVADRRGTRCGLSAVVAHPPQSFDTLSVLRCFSVHHACKESLFELPYPSCSARTDLALLLGPALINKAFPPTGLLLTGCFSHHSV